MLLASLKGSFRSEMHLTLINIRTNVADGFWFGFTVVHKDKTENLNHIYSIYIWGYLVLLYIAEYFYFNAGKTFLMVTFSTIYTEGFPELKQGSPCSACISIGSQVLVFKIQHLKSKNGSNLNAIIKDLRPIPVQFLLQRNLLMEKQN